LSHARKVGLARALSKLGYCSRSRAAELIRAGRVTLNDRVRRDTETPTDLTKDRIQVDGRPLAAESKVYLVLNKPRGIVTTASDEKGRETVYRFLHDLKVPWLAPVGRLDKASEGLLLLTNDSEWAAKILAPETHLDKNYHVRINVAADDALISTLIKGVETDAGRLRVKSARVIRGGELRTWLELALDEGKNRHIRRMFEHLKIEVLRLVRIAIGPLILGDLPKGGVRPLTHAEKAALDKALGDHRVRG
jgi:23S rRNA pseudouridine2605 synthase